MIPLSHRWEYLEIEKACRQKYNSDIPIDDPLKPVEYSTTCFETFYYNLITVLLFLLSR